MPELPLILQEGAPTGEFELYLATVENGQFSPAELRTPANKPFVIMIKNNGAKAMEFESVSLRVEKIVAAKSQASVRVRALAPGRYEFFDDFNKSTKGTLVVQ